MMMQRFNLNQQESNVIFRTAKNRLSGALLALMLLGASQAALPVTGALAATPVNFNRPGTFGLSSQKLLAVVHPPQAVPARPSQPETNQQDAKTVSFVAFGDTGSGAKQQFDVEKRMEALYAKSPFTAVLLLGDIIYPMGNIVLYGKSRYLDVYKPLTSKGVTFIDAFGNHDALNPNVVQQLHFYGMPDRYYTKPLDANNLVQVFVLDTNHFSHDKPQIAWLENALKSSTARWKIVAGHHPMYTSGAHEGDGDLTLLRKELEPILVKYKVQLYLAGHDHDYERFEPQQGVQSIVSGGGGAYIREFNHPKLPITAYRSAIHHFLQITATPSQITINAINKKGEVFDTVTLR